MFTAGFSNLPLERFLTNLRFFDIQLVVDVRSKPFARYTPHFNRDQIERAARAAGLRYAYMGQHLGGLPDNPGFYDRQGYVLYDRIAVQPGFRQGMDWLRAEADNGVRLVLACGEDDPRRCHRRLLLGHVLREGGIGVAHIMADGTLVAESELLDEERSAQRQLSLLDGAQQERTWKSARPVALKDRQEGLDR